MSEDRRVLYVVMGVAGVCGLLLGVGAIFFGPSEDPQAAVRARAAAAPEENHTAKLAVYDADQVEQVRGMLDASHPAAQRAAAAQRLGQLQDFESADQLLEMLDDPSPLVRGRAGVALTKILGIHFGFRANAPAKERAKIVRTMRQVVEFRKKNPPPKHPK